MREADADRIQAVLERASLRGAGFPVASGGIASRIDHTLLRPEATREEILRLCDEGLLHGFAAVCIHPVRVGAAVERLRGSAVKVAAVAGFPLGASLTQVKALEVSRALDEGAVEIDMVQNVGLLKDGEDDLVRRELEAIAAICAREGAILKIILETALLSDEEKVRAAWIARDAGANFVKTSTGFGPGGATVRDVTILREAVGAGMGVKASGGIRSLAEARAMLGAGATRLGTSSGVRMVGEEAAEALGG